MKESDTIMYKSTAQKNHLKIITFLLVSTFGFITVQIVQADEMRENQLTVITQVNQEITSSLFIQETATGIVSEETSLAAREVQCLALNIYFEARSESEQGQLAVGHVVMNRVANKHYPDTLCGVIQQGGEKRLNRCQFSWWCDGRSDKPVNQRAWQLSLQLAEAIYSGKTIDPTEGALWYHADYVNPYWSDQFTVAKKIGQHVFYQKKIQQKYALN